MCMMEAGQLNAVQLGRVQVVLALSWSESRCGHELCTCRVDSF